MKKSIKTTLFVISGLAVGLGIHQVFKSSSPADSSVVADESKPVDMLNPMEPVITGNGQPAESVAAAQSTESIQPSHFEWYPSAQEAVIEFSELSEKVFPNPDETMRKSEILMNADFLRNIADYLLTGNNVELKNQAVDMIVAAMKMGSPEASAQAERIISDGQIEDSRLPASVRQNMAETKGEILSEFAALGEANEAKVPSMLPGKVSQKIWRNVQEFHNQNERESQKELGEVK